MAPETLPTTSNYLGFLLQSLLVLGGVCLLAWVVLRFGLRFLTPRPRSSAFVRVVDRVPLEPRRTLYVVEVAGKLLLIGSSESGPMTTLAELPLAELPSDRKTEPTSFLRLLSRKKDA